MDFSRFFCGDYNLDNQYFVTECEIVEECLWGVESQSLFVVALLSDRLCDASVCYWRRYIKSL